MALTDQGGVPELFHLQCRLPCALSGWSFGSEQGSLPGLAFNNAVLTLRKCPGGGRKTHHTGPCIPSTRLEEELWLRQLKPGSTWGSARVPTPDSLLESTPRALR